MKIDADGTVYIQERDLSKIKDIALREYLFFGANTSDNLLCKSYVSAVINYLVSNNIIPNVNIKFGEIDEQPNIK